MHHLSYANGWGGGKVDDLIPLCEWHHDKVHKEKRLDWMLKDGVTPNDTKRKIVLYYLRMGSVPSIATAEAANETKALHPLSREMKRKVHRVKPKVSRENAQAVRVWQAGRVHARHEAMKAFGWIK